jgi:hypothetical protein
METIDNTMKLFFAELKAFSHSNITFKVNYEKDQIEIVDAPSGFLRKLYADDKACAHLHDGVIKLSYFKA